MQLYPRFVYCIMCIDQISQRRGVGDYKPSLIYIPACILYLVCLPDITKACLIEGFQNQAYLLAADRVLKTLGKAKAAEKYKVSDL